MLIDFNHERVLTPIGLCIDDSGYPMIILPLMVKGDLLTYLRNDQNLLTIRQLIGFGKQISEGINLYKL